jgi:hypothetical protein
LCGHPPGGTNKNKITVTKELDCVSTGIIPTLLWLWLWLCSCLCPSEDVQISGRNMLEVTLQLHDLIYYCTFVGINIVFSYWVSEVDITRFLFRPIRPI